MAADAPLRIIFLGRIELALRQQHAALLCDLSESVRLPMRVLLIVCRSVTPLHDKLLDF